MMVLTVLLLTYSFGLLVLSPRGVGWFMLCATTLCCLGQLLFGPRVGVPPAVIVAEDVSAWPYSVGLLIKWVTFIRTLHWPGFLCSNACFL